MPPIPRLAAAGREGGGRGSGVRAVCRCATALQRPHGGIVGVGEVGVIRGGGDGEGGPWWRWASTAL
jgi:hypothetical protein